MAVQARRAFDAALGASVALALVDVARVAMRGSLSLSLLVLILALAISAGLLGALALLVLGKLHGMRPSANAPIRLVIRLGATLTLLLPSALVATEVIGTSAYPSAIVAFSALVIAVCAYKLTQGAWITGLVIAVAATTLTLRLQLSLNVLQRLNPASIDALFIVALVTCAIPVGLGLVTTLSVHAIATPRLSRIVVAVALALGVLAVGAAFAAPETYPSASDACFLFAFLCLSIGAARLPTARGAGSIALRAIAACGALGVVLGVHAVAAFTQASWSLARDSRVARAIAIRMSLFEQSQEHRKMTLRLQPSYRLGAQAAEGAIAWNERAGPPPIHQKPRSIVLITVDTLRFDHVGYSGLAPAGLTPAIDALAARSARFHAAYSHASQTALSLPSTHWSLYPGSIYPKSYGSANTSAVIEPLGGYTPLSEDILRISRTNLLVVPSKNVAEVLSGSGMRTLAALNDGPYAFFLPEYGYARGFQQWVHPRTELSHSTGHEVASVDDASTVNFALDLLSKRANEPFFLWVHLFSPHEWGAQPSAKPGEPSPYARAVSSTDQAVGRLLSGLADLNRANETLIALTADHGEELGDHGTLFHGGNLFDETIHVPLLLSIPGEPTPDITTPVGLMDLAPTLLQAMDLPVPSSMQGYSLWPQLRGDAAQRPPVLSETWQYEGKGSTIAAHARSVISGDYKLIYDERLQVYSLFDRANDPKERHNLAGQLDMMATFNELSAYLLGWSETERRLHPHRRDAE